MVGRAVMTTGPPQFQQDGSPPSGVTSRPSTSQGAQVQHTSTRVSTDRSSMTSSFRPGFSRPVSFYPR